MGYQVQKFHPENKISNIKHFNRWIKIMINTNNYHYYDLQSYDVQNNQTESSCFYIH